MPVQAQVQPAGPLGRQLAPGKPFAGILATIAHSRGLGGGHAAEHVRAPASDGSAGAHELTTAGRGSASAPEAVDAERRSRRGGQDAGPDDGERAGHDEARDLDLLDPASRHAASLAAPLMIAWSTNRPVLPEALLRARSLEELLPALVRRIAWAGDRHRGTVRLELGAGAHAGTTVIVHADGGRLRVELSGTEGPELDRLRSRLEGRLRGHGLDLESVT